MAKGNSTRREKKTLSAECRKIEFGSEYASVDDWQSKGSFLLGISDNTVGVGSGRDALILLVRHGLAHRGWHRLWVPSFLCQEVVRSVADTKIPIATYPHLPTQPLEEALSTIPVRAGDTVLVVNHFGLRKPWPELVSALSPAEVIEDHTHDLWSPWAKGSNAHFCIASLRKLLPVPEGGLIWSPAALELPPEPALTKERRLAAELKRAAMQLKALYLQGVPVEKSMFRELFAQGEEHIASGEVSGMTSLTKLLLPHFPVHDWRSKRFDNIRQMGSLLDGTKGLSILTADSEKECPFSCVCVFDSHELREHVRQTLITERIYPAILWSLSSPVFPDQVSDEDLQLSQRVLSIHADARYNAKDIEYIANTIRRGVEGFRC